ncbi:MAG: GIY-YIG nuclease family protein [Cellulosilyticum sp.]|nr:GIY-YIG nuclease family protein [Cellulosilyticum sp.]
MIGIYKITNTVDNRSYIGQSKDIKLRFRKHRYRLNKGIHHNCFLQRAWDKYGESFFTFEVVEECLEEELDLKETYYISMYDSFNNGFNMSVGGEGALGYRHSEEMKKSMHLRNTGKNNPNSRKVICEDRVFDTLRECANYYQIKEKTMHKWLCGYRKMRDDFKKRGLSYFK